MAGCVSKGAKAWKWRKDKEGRKGRRGRKAGKGWEAGNTGGCKHSWWGDASRFPLGCHSTTPSRPTNPTLPLSHSLIPTFPHLVQQPAIAAPPGSRPTPLPHSLTQKPIPPVSRPPSPRHYRKSQFRPASLPVSLPPLPSDAPSSLFLQPFSPCPSIRPCLQPD